MIELAQTNDRSRVGRVVTCRYVFGSCGLGFLAYQRNKHKGDVVTGVKNCLRVVALERKGQTEYGSLDDHQTSVSLELGEEALMGVHAVLSGQCKSYVYRVPRKGHIPKQLEVRYQPGSKDGAFYASLGEGGRSYATPFGHAQSFGFQMVIAAVLQLEYPDRSEDVLVNNHLRMARLYAEGVAS